MWSGCGYDYTGGGGAGQCGGACGGALLAGTDGTLGGQGCDPSGADSGGGNGGLADNRIWTAEGQGGGDVFCTDNRDSGGGGGAAGRLRVRTSAAPGALVVDSEAVLRLAPCGATVEDCFGTLSIY